MSAERHYVAQKEFNPSGPLGQIPDLIKHGAIPPEFWPVSDEDFAAIGILQREWAAHDPDLLVRATTINFQSFPPSLFWRTVAVLAYPLLSPDAPLAQQLAAAWDAPLNLDGLDRQTCNLQEIAILAARLRDLFKHGPPAWSSEGQIYAYLSVCQTSLIHIWPDFSGNATRGVSIRTMFKWLLTTFTLALTMQARAMLEALFVGIGTATPGLPQRAADWLLGRTDDPDAFVAAQARIYSWDGAWMQELAIQWAQIPPARLRQQPDEPRARELFVDQVMRRDWEQAADIRSAIRVGGIKDFDERRRGDGEKTKRRRVSSDAHPLTTKRGTPDPLADERLKLGTSPAHPLESSPLPVSEVDNHDTLNLAFDLVKACHELGVSDDEIRLWLARAGSMDRQIQSDIAGFRDEHHLKAVEDKVHRAMSKLREKLAAYGPPK
jgi:hypothetical protein